MITIQDLDLVNHLVATGSICKTGNRLGVSPAVVSKRISAFEDKLGTQLFYRPSARLELTASGQAFYDRTNAILAQARRTPTRFTTGTPANDNANQELIAELERDGHDASQPKEMLAQFLNLQATNIAGPDRLIKELGE